MVYIPETQHRWIILPQQIHNQVWKWAKLPITAVLPQRPRCLHSYVSNLIIYWHVNETRIFASGGKKNHSLQDKQQEEQLEVP